MIVPRVKKEEYTGKNFWADTALTLCVRPEYAANACTALRAFLPQCSVMQTTENAFITVSQEHFENTPEAYRLELHETGVHITCCDYAGLRNALAVFSLLAVFRDGRLQLPECRIEDAPIGRYRSVMLDLATHTVPTEVLHRELILAAKARMNRIHLYLSDRHGCALALDCLPPECLLPNAYTGQQLRELCDFAEALGLTVIPEFDMPAHSQKLREVFPVFCCDVPIPEGKVVTSVCTGEPAVYTLYEKIIYELAEIFPGPYIHMGGDEVEMRDLNIICQWDDCPRCRTLRQKHGLADRQEQYYYFVKRIHAMAKKKGRTLILWSDQIDCPRGAQLPTDIILQFWRVAHPDRGPHIGCSMGAQAALGYDVINSYYPYTYPFTGEEVLLTAELLQDWHWDTDPDCPPQYTDRMLGGELCAWGYTLDAPCAYMGRHLPSAIALLADKFWNNAPLVYTADYRRGLTRLLLGAAVPDDFDVFSAIGTVLPPAANDRYACPENVTLTESELEAVLTVLAQTDLYAAGDGCRARELCTCVEAVLQEKRNPHV